MSDRDRADRIPGTGPGRSGAGRLLPRTAGVSPERDNRPMRQRGRHYDPDGTQWELGEESD